MRPAWPQGRLREGDDVTVALLEKELGYLHVERLSQEAGETRVRARQPLGHARQPPTGQARVLGEQPVEVPATDHQDGGGDVRTRLVRHRHAQEQLDVPVDVTGPQGLDHRATRPARDRQLQAALLHDVDPGRFPAEVVERLARLQGAHAQELSQSLQVARVQGSDSARPTQRDTHTASRNPGGTSIARPVMALLDPSTPSHPPPARPRRPGGLSAR